MRLVGCSAHYVFDIIDVSSRGAVHCRTYEGNLTAERIVIREGKGGSLETHGLAYHHPHGAKPVDVRSLSCRVGVCLRFAAIRPQARRRPRALF